MDCNCQCASSISTPATKKCTKFHLHSQHPFGTGWYLTLSEHLTDEGFSSAHANNDHLISLYTTLISVFSYQPEYVVYLYYAVDMYHMWNGVCVGDARILLEIVWRHRWDLNIATTRIKTIYWSVQIARSSLSDVRKMWRFIFKDLSNDNISVCFEYSGCHRNDKFRW